MSPIKVYTPVDLDQYETAVLKALDPEYEYLVLVVPGMAGISEVAAGFALASLARKKLVKTEGRTPRKAVFTTDAGATLRTQILEQA